MKLQDQLDAFKAAFEAGKLDFNPPAGVHSLLRRGNDELIASGIAGNALSAGDIAPHFILQDAQGNTVSSAQLLSQGPLIVSFYRGRWCPYCNLDLQALQAAMPEFLARAVNVVAISPQTPANGQIMMQERTFTFPLLADPGNTVAASFGLNFRLPDYLIELYLHSFNTNLADFNDDDSWILPMPARFVIAPSGKIVCAQVSPDYTQRADPLEVLPVLERLR
ncbi:alkyl hydroperoxide reductase [Serratia oryzae]|uniref:thioredoxin-dependent peroxiredoxin n=2 Tax=Serratia oryzae TaxID=2034155 RepID=A0A1S8CQL6_9GAMM|nr:alkyl hydroperoxide reductase [Serratia oryzae]